MGISQIRRVVKKHVPYRDKNMYEGYRSQGRLPEGGVLKGLSKITKIWLYRGKEMKGHYSRKNKE